jgi:ElaB/YqjD/DUF883 family membrane-anchored ribosome-binding protein
MVTAEELVVSITSTGAGETQDQLEGVEEKMDDTAESAGDSAEELEGFAARFRGAMAAAVSALAIGAAGLLSQVPVVGEAMAGLRAIIDAVILQIDDDLRPTVGSLRDEFFEVAEEVRNADGTLESLETALNGVDQAVQDVAVESLQQEIRNLTGITIPNNWLDLGWDIITLDTRNAVDTLKRVIREFPQDFGTLIGSLSPKAKREYDQLRQQTSSLVSDLTSDFDGGVSGIRESFNGLSSDLSEWAGNVAEDAREWGKNLIQKFIQGIRSLLGRLENFLGDLQDVGATVGIDIPDLGSLGGGGGGGGGGSGRLPFRGSGTGTGGTQIDGRQLTESTGRYRSDPGRRRGL